MCSCGLCYPASVTASLVPAVLLLLTLFLAPFGVYAYALGRSGRPLTAFAAGSALLLGLIALALTVGNLPG